MVPFVNTETREQKRWVKKKINTVFLLTEEKNKY